MDICTCEMQGRNVGWMNHGIGCPRRRPPTAEEIRALATAPEPPESDDIQFNYAPEVQPYPGGLAQHQSVKLPDPRLGCWFCGEAATALAPRHSGGDVDVPAHWVPVCASHEAHWHDDTDAGEALPIIPRNGVALSVKQAERVLGDYLNAFDGDDDDIVRTLEAGLRALNDKTGDTP